MPFDPKNPEVKHASYDRLEQLRQLPGDLLGGLPALLARKAVYFPREIADGWPVTKKGITVDPYLNRISRTTLFNMFKEGINDQLVGRVFARKVRFAEETPVSIQGSPEEKIAGFVDDVDGKATNAHVFLRRRFRNAAAKGLDGVLVEYPSTKGKGPLSVNESKRAGLRPYWRPYASAAVLDWEFQFIVGAERFVYLKLLDYWTDPTTRMRMPALRVFTADGVGPVQFQVWVKRANVLAEAPTKPNDYVLVDEGSRTPHVEIPFVPFTTDGDEPMEAEPELVDAAWLNLAHCRKTGALDNAQHAINFPVRWASGVSKKDATDQLAGGIASDFVWISEAPGGQFGISEPQGTAWAAAEVTIASIERRIQSLLNKPMERASSQPLTAQGEANSEAARMSRLESWVQGLTDATNTLLYFTAIDLGEIKPGAEGGWGGAEFNTNWTDSHRDIERADRVFTMVDAGYLSRQSGFEALKECGIPPEDADFEEEQLRIEEEGLGGPLGADIEADKKAATIAEELAVKGVVVGAGGTEGAAA